MIIRIQHSPGRESIERLLKDLPPDVEIIEDSVSPWSGYQRCLSDLPDAGHVLVLQDDCIIARNFLPALVRIAEANECTPVSLFLSKAPRRTHNLALLRWGRSRYVDVHPQDLVHVVGILWPVVKAREFMEWITENPKRIRGLEEGTSDDAHVTRWARLAGQRIRCTVPSLVQHLDDVPSIVNAHRVAEGRDSGRTAAFWIGDGDPLELDWSR